MLSALCLYTKPFGDFLGSQGKNLKIFFRTPASPPSGRCAGGPTRRSPVGSPPESGPLGSGPLCSLLYPYVLNLLGILGVSSEKNLDFFFGLPPLRHGERRRGLRPAGVLQEDGHLAAPGRRQGSTNGSLRTSSRRCRPNASPQSSFRLPSGPPGALCLPLP